MEPRREACVLSPGGAGGDSCFFGSGLDFNAFFDAVVRQPLPDDTFSRSLLRGTDDLLHSFAVSLRKAGSKEERAVKRSCIWRAGV